MSASNNWKYHVRQQTNKAMMNRLIEGTISCTEMVVAATVHARVERLGIEDRLLVETPAGWGVASFSFSLNAWEIEGGRDTVQTAKKRICGEEDVDYILSSL